MIIDRTARLLACGVVAFAALLAASPRAFAQEIPDCPDPFKNGVGPFDYTSAADLSDPQHIPIVEQYHFTPRVESLQGGSTGAYALTDLDYTLRAIPNHHRALNAVVRYDLSHGGTPSQFRPVQCWFDRAFAFKPDDGMVWMIYGNWKSGKNDTKTALEAYQKAKALLPDSVEVKYNLGLLYVRLGEYEQARDCARDVYAAGYPLQGLRRRLAEKGYSLDAP